MFRAVAIFTGFENEPRISVSRGNMLGNAYREYKPTRNSYKRMLKLVTLTRQESLRITVWHNAPYIFFTDDKGV